MRKAKTLILTLLLLMAAASTTMAQNWQTVYETDFSTDPGWITNNPDRFHWDTVSGSYFTDNYTNSQEWAKTDITYSGESFRLTFDVLPVRESWETGDVNVGLFGPTMVSNSSDTEERVYVMIGGYGGVIYITGYDSGGEYIYSGAGSGLMQESTSHHVVILYDSETLLLSLDVTVNSVPVLAWQTVLSHGFSSNMVHLGASMVGSWVTSNRHEVAYIDNVSLSLQTHCGEDDLVQLTSEGGYTARWSPDGSKLVFTSIRHGNHEIYTMNADGTDQTRLTYHPSYDKLPSWHPSGNSIVFVSTRDGNHDIYTMNADGSGITRFIAHPAWDDVPFWSPDGSKLLFESSRDGDWEVHTIDADGTNLTQLTHNTAVDGNHAWSPTGDRISYISRVAGLNQVHVMSADGSNQTNLSNNPHWEDYPTFTPDGRIIFTSDRDGNDEIYVMDADGGNQTRLTYCPASEGQPYVSPDGQWLVFHSDRSGTRNIYKMRMSGPFAIAAFLDIKPGSCPNALNVKSNGHGQYAKVSQAEADGLLAGSVLSGRKGPVLPVAILGTANFDVMDIDATTVTLDGLPALRSNYEDVSTPMIENAGACDCHILGADGFIDLTLKFDRTALIELLGEVYDGDEIPLAISGLLNDGMHFEGVDCVVIRGERDGDDGGEYSRPTSGAPMKFALTGNYPNPFNPSTEISFSLPVASDVVLTIYNMLGQTVAVVVDEPMTAGHHTVKWDASQVASGVYFYRLSVPEFTDTKKMMLLK